MNFYRLIPYANLALGAAAFVYLLWPFALLRTWAVIGLASALLWYASRCRRTAASAVGLGIRLIDRVKPPTA